MTRSKKTKPSTSSVGETLVSQYADRLAVRQARDKVGVLARGEALAAGQGKIAIPGRQTSPELASLAAKYINFEADDTARVGEALARDVRRLAASVLSQASEE